MNVMVVLLLGWWTGSLLALIVNHRLQPRLIARSELTCCVAHNRISVLNLVPFADLATLRRRCRACGKRSGSDTFFIASGTTGLFVLVAIKFEYPIVASAYFIFSAGLVIQTAIDFRTKRLPREITYTTIAFGTPLLAIAGFVTDEPRRFAAALFGSIIATSVMGFLYFVSRGGLGEGDVRFAPLLGLFLGWLNPALPLVGLLFAFGVGAAVGVALMIAGRADRRTSLPFGPFLATGSLIALFFGQHFIEVLGG